MTWFCGSRNSRTMADNDLNAFRDATSLGLAVSTKHLLRPSRHRASAVGAPKDLLSSPSL